MLLFSAFVFFALAQRVDPGVCVGTKNSGIDAESARESEKMIELLENANDVKFMIKVHHETENRKPGKSGIIRKMLLRPAFKLKNALAPKSTPRGYCGTKNSGIDAERRRKRQRVCKYYQNHQKRHKTF